MKTNKTAGTSIEIALSRFCGPDDVITPISLSDERKRLEWGGVGAQNYGMLRNHSTAEDARKVLGDARWNDYFKFCFERNPWDRAVSLYLWRKRVHRLNFERFVCSSELDLMEQRGTGLYEQQGRVMVDKIFRYEDLDAAMGAIALRLRLNAPLELPLTKQRSPEHRRPYADFYSDQSKKIVEARFESVIRRFGYQF